MAVFPRWSSTMGGLVFATTPNNDLVVWHFMRFLIALGKIVSIIELSLFRCVTNTRDIEALERGASIINDGVVVGVVCY